MMNRLISLFILISSNAIVFSQGKHKFEAGTSGGYEYNYFRSPTEISVGEEILHKEDLISSSLYQDLEMKYNYRYKSRKNKLRFAINPSSRIFYENIDDSYWNLKTKANYEHKFSRKSGAFVEGRFERMNREGLGGSQDVLINPLGFSNYGVSSGVFFGLIRRNELKLEAFYNFKDFDAFGVRDLQYQEYGGTISSVQKFRTRKLTHTLGLSITLKKRMYDTYNGDSSTPEGIRDWDYVKGVLNYGLPVSKVLEFKPGYTYYVRIDNSSGRSGFKQYGPKIGLKYDNKTTTIRTSFSYITREYSDLEARDNEGKTGEKITYGYANFGLNGAHKIGRNLFFTATVFSRIRKTNYTDIAARSFRNYRNQYVGIGILSKF
ncbi:hypothetical protein ACFSTE_06200 [Aquimarina hainanensis]|uniref:DUF4421 domain-containing protein n=1 Tax=Aquimarina hainanensis TaxID=1578017 RepID=A0ABW5N4G1_9FLAO